MARHQFDRWIEVANQAAAHEEAHEYKFQELYSRAPWECRFDLTMLRGGTVLGASAAPAADSDDSACWTALLAIVDPLVKPILRASGLFGDDPIDMEAVGCVLSFPGAPCQCWHPDSESQVGLVNCFVPLVYLSEANGPTALRLGSQDGRTSCLPPVQPLIASGSLLLFDWRVWHRGCAKCSRVIEPRARRIQSPCRPIRPLTLTRCIGLLCAQPQRPRAAGGLHHLRAQRC